MAEQRISDERLANLVQPWPDDPPLICELARDLRDARADLATALRVIDRLTDGCNWRHDLERAVWVRTLSYEVTHGTGGDAWTEECFEYPTEPMSEAEVQWFTEREADHG